MSYKVAPSLSSYTQEELISSKAGPQGTATYDEMEYDPIAQERLSAEAVSKVDCVNLISKKAAFTGKEKNFYRVSFRDASQYSNFATPDWATRAAQTMGIKYYQTPNCKIVMGYKNGKWEIQAVLVPNTENMTKQKALKIGNHMQDRIEREGQWAKKKCREDEIVEIYEAEEYGAETFNTEEGKKCIWISQELGAYCKKCNKYEERKDDENYYMLIERIKDNVCLGAETFGADSKPYRVDVSRSTNKEKKLMAVFEDKDGKKIKTTHFGARGMSDYTKHGDKERMKRYNNRHRKNENWNQPMTAGSLSKYILWNTPSLQGSFKDYKRRFGLKGDLKVSRSAETFEAMSTDETFTGETASGHKVEWDDGSFTMTFAEPIDGFTYVGGDWYGGDNESPDEFDLLVETPQGHRNFYLRLDNVESYGVDTSYMDLTDMYDGGDSENVSPQVREAVKEGLDWMLGDYEEKTVVERQYRTEEYGAEGGEIRKGAMYGAGAVVGITGATLALGAIFSLIGRRS
jgi:hypothetical protein